MPIHDQGYRRYTRRRLQPGGRWTVIARAELAARLRERRSLALLLLAWIPFSVRALQFYASASFAQLSFLAPGADTFREFLDQQGVFLFFITLYAGSGLIADDRRANALQLYLSRPITRAQYVGGKLLVLAVLLLAASWMPAMSLLALQVLLAGSVDFIRDNPWLVPGMTLLCVVEALVVSLVMLGLSSLSKSRRFVAVLYAGAILVATAMSQVLSSITGSDAWAWLSPEAVFDALAIAIFHTAERAALPPSIALAAVATAAAVSIVVLSRCVRAVDVSR